MAYNFKSESEVKEYINNLGIEYRFGCYSEKKPEGRFLHNLIVGISDIKIISFIL